MNNTEYYWFKNDIPGSGPVLHLVEARTRYPDTLVGPAYFVEAKHPLLLCKSEDSHWAHIYCIGEGTENDYTRVSLMYVAEHNKQVSNTFNYWDWFQRLYKGDK